MEKASFALGFFTAWINNHPFQGHPFFPLPGAQEFLRRMSGKYEKGSYYIPACEGHILDKNIRIIFSFDLDTLLLSCTD
jgi:hypothetical protein